MPLLGWTREPIVHFLAAATALFLYFAWVGEPADPASRTITVTREDRAAMALQWERTMQRPPTDAELDTLVEIFLREEVLYREAIRLGLDRDDTVVRKRLANKMDYLAASMAETSAVPDAALADWLQQHPERFAPDVRYSFDQMYFTERAAAAVALADGAAEGEAISLPPAFDNASRIEVEGRLGRAFTGALDTLEPGSAWAGPVASGFGWHLVRLRTRAVGEAPALADIRTEVEADWRSSTEAQRKKDAYELLRSAYRVTVQK
ncbi:peptidylprolyl isomerase [Allopontixanthobacter sp.]|uniref:peptidylprolyl isomerase n=1 Tax=Allopontixanthobacter sp. TaxID=2906452 RepID=UPI002ABB6E98|nr:peptidylprolyl isomerase [Allopontixanthobacter sp.]MDZ4308685.1 peptidylprolyl isomerase [Allopontixanthobacter sp.]